MEFAIAPSPSLEPASVVEAQLAAMQKGDVRTFFKFFRRSPGQAKFERMVRQSPAWSPLIGCTSFEITSALTVAPRKWRCRVTVRPAGSSSAPFAVANPFMVYSWQLFQQADKEAEFGLGQCLRHRKYGYRGVIVGYDLTCKQSEEWIRMMGVDGLSSGRAQPFYHVLVDARDRPGAQATYVAQENVVADSPPEQLRLPHAQAEKLLRLTSFDARRGEYEVMPELRAFYPSGVAGCWMVDTVRQDRPTGIE